MLLSIWTPFDVKPLLSSTGLTLPLSLNYLVVIYLNHHLDLIVFEIILIFGNIIFFSKDYRIYVIFRRLRQIQYFKIICYCTKIWAHTTTSSQRRPFTFYTSKFRLNLFLPHSLFISLFLGRRRKWQYRTSWKWKFRQYWIQWDKHNPWQLWYWCTWDGYCSYCTKTWSTDWWQSDLCGRNAHGVQFRVKHRIFRIFGLKCWI